MNLFELLLTNAVTATGLAVVVYLITRVVKQPPIVYGLWMLVLLKLAIPPLVDIPIVTSVVEKPGDVITVYLDAENREITELVAPDSGSLARASANEPVAAESFVLELIDEDSANSDHGATQSAVLGTTADRSDSTSDSDRVAAGPSAGGDLEAGWWHRTLAFIWIAGAVLYLALLIHRTVRFRRVLRNAPSAPKHIVDRVGALSSTFGLATPPAVRLVDSAIPPLLWPFGRASTVLIPAQLVPRIDDTQLDTLLAHELAHLRRRDHWVRAFEVALLACYWWFPVLRWVLSHLREAEEQCCDAWVLWRFPEHARDYARTLLTTVDFLSETREDTSRALTPPAAIPAALTVGRRGKPGRNPRFELLKRRFEMILHRRFPRRLSAKARIGLIVASVLVLPLAPLAVSAEADGTDKIVIVKADGTKHEFEVNGKLGTQIHDAIESVIRSSDGDVTKRTTRTTRTTHGSDVHRHSEDHRIVVAGDDGQVLQHVVTSGDGPGDRNIEITGADGKVIQRIQVDGTTGDHRIIVADDGGRIIKRVISGGGATSERHIEIAGADGKIIRRIQVGGNAGMPKGGETRTIKKIIISDENGRIQEMRVEGDGGQSELHDIFGGHSGAKSKSTDKPKSSIKGKVIINGEEHEFDLSDRLDGLLGGSGLGQLHEHLGKLKGLEALGDLHELKGLGGLLKLGDGGGLDALHGALRLHGHDEDGHEHDGGHNQKGRSSSKKSGRVLMIGPDGKKQEFEFGADFDDLDIDLDIDLGSLGLDDEDCDISGILSLDGGSGMQLGGVLKGLNIEIDGTDGDLDGALHQALKKLKGTIKSGEGQIELKLDTGDIRIDKTKGTKSGSSNFAGGKGRKSRTIFRRDGDKAIELESHDAPKIIEIDGKKYRLVPHNPGVTSGKAKSPRGRFVPSKGQGGSFSLGSGGGGQARGRLSSGKSQGDGATSGASAFSGRGSKPKQKSKTASGSFSLGFGGSSGGGASTGAGPAAGDLNKVIQRAVRDALRAAGEGDELDTEELEKAIREAIQNVGPSRKGKGKKSTGRSIRFGSGASSGLSSGSASQSGNAAGAEVRAQELRDTIDGMKPTMDKLQEAIDSLEKKESKGKATKTKKKVM